MKYTLNIRLIKESDAGQALDVYAPYVLNDSVTFEYEIPTEEEFLQRIRNTIVNYPWLVCVQDEKIMGYAYANKFRPRSAYTWSPESTIYLSGDAQGKGTGKILYETLFAVLKLQGFINVFAGVVLPNEKSERLHTSLGFEEIGTYKNIGFKFSKWHSTKWFQLILSDHILNPERPKTIDEIKDTQEFRAIIHDANALHNIIR